MFSPEQIKELQAPLQSSNVKERRQAGRALSYIEAWKAISEANRIFGFDGWRSETVDIKCVAERERKIGQPQRAGWGVTYTAKVRISIGNEIVREGTGAGHGIDVDLGLAHESAIKEAESDARKRALMTFGNPFGLALYDKEQREVVDDTRPLARPPLPPEIEPDERLIPTVATSPKPGGTVATSYYMLARRTIDAMSGKRSRAEAVQWWKGEAENRRKNNLSQEQADALRHLMDMTFPLDEAAA